MIWQKTAMSLTETLKLIPKTNLGISIIISSDLGTANSRFILT